MSLHLAKLRAADKRHVMTRDQTLALKKAKKYNDGRTKQCHKDECDIVKIMARFDRTGTISHVNKYEAAYADYSDFDYHDQLQKLTKGREIFDELPAEIRREFNQSPTAFFEFVNDPANKDDLLKKLPALAAPGDQHRGLGDPEPPPEPVPTPEPAPDPEPTPDPPA